MATDMENVVVLVAAVESVNGKYFRNIQEHPASNLLLDKNLQETFRTLSKEMTNKFLV